MARRIFTIITLLLLLSSCASPDQDMSNEYIGKSDYPYMYHSTGNGTQIAYSDKGYYFLNGDYIYFMDKQNNSPVILDNRPDNGCVDNSEDRTNCNAYVSHASPSDYLFIQYYEDHLYTMESRVETGKAAVYELVRRNPDGSNRKVMKTFSNGVVKSVNIHRGFLYYSVQDYDKDSNMSYQLLRLPLERLSKKPEILYVGEYKQGSISDVLAYGAQIYFIEFTDTGYRTMRYDLKTTSTEPLWLSNDGGYAALSSIHDKHLYFKYYYPTIASDNSDLFDKRTLVIYRSQLDGSDIRATNIKSSPIISNVYIDSQYTYVRPVWFQLTKVKDVANEMKIYKDGNLVQTLDMSPFSLTHNLFVGDENNMFVIEFTGDKSVLYYLNKSAIESANAKFIRMLETSVRTQ
ncbi:hypothetical protein [Paenibacillus aquistagni]|uniref:hypothetical protein n=1 Tax=Paenibacillus aquistagni TaxID=1852522 RepID=UPI000B51368C|nr:hypothetical protein [Paenibacillus aquistagni]NMM55111.1 hypothetical protein [Paenibacillus aquistagni]